MAFGSLDAVLFNPTAGSTTDWTYSSAVTGYQSPAAAGAVDSTVYYYRAYSSDLTQWEEGYGAWNSSTSVLARTTVLFNSAGNTSKINFTNPPFVAIVAPTSFFTNADNLLSGTVDPARLGSGGAGAGLKYLADDKSFKTIVTPKAADQQTFTSSGNWTKPSGFGAKAYALIQVWGPGGGAARDSNAGFIGGGGGGAYDEVRVPLSSLGSTETVTIGAGGIGKTGSSGEGGNGGSTSFGSWAQAYGGEGGASTNNSTGRAGQGGGLYQVGGNTGIDADNYWNGGKGGRAGAAPGRAVFGGGGGGGGQSGSQTGGSSKHGSPGASAVAGTPSKPGFGGGGGSSTSTNTNGGDGGDGKVIVTVIDGA